MVQAMARYAQAIGGQRPADRVQRAPLLYDLRLKTALEAREIPAEDAKSVARAAEGMGVHVQAFTREGYYFELANAFSELYARGIGGLEGEAVGEKLSDWISSPLCKLLLIAEPPAASRSVGARAQVFGHGDRVSGPITWSARLWRAQG